MTHLTPYATKDRAREVQHVLAHAAATVPAGEPAVLMGDFNALSPHDAPQHARQGLTRRLSRRKELRSKFTVAGGHQLDYGPLRTLIGAGWTDAAGELAPGSAAPTVPTALAVDAMHAGAMRLDHQLVKGADRGAGATGPLALGGAGAVDTAATRPLSDHLPVLLTLCETDDAQACRAAGSRLARALRDRDAALSCVWARDDMRARAAARLRQARMRRALRDDARVASVAPLPSRGAAPSAAEPPLVWAAVAAARGQSCDAACTAAVVPPALTSAARAGSLAEARRAIWEDPTFDPFAVPINATVPPRAAVCVAALFPQLNRCTRLRAAFPCEDGCIAGDGGADQPAAVARGAGEGGGRCLTRPAPARAVAGVSRPGVCGASHPDTYRLCPCAVPTWEAVAGSLGQSCTAACEAKGQRCVPALASQLNECRALRAAFPCERGCVASVGDDQPAYALAARDANARKCLVSRSRPTARTCDASHPDTRRLCPCARAWGP